MNVLNVGNLPVYSWCPEIEDSAQAQIENLSNLDVAFHHVAIMPDCHMGYGMPIGGVLATREAIIPNAVGVDIGCGVAAVETPYFDSEVRSHLNDVVAEIKNRIPVGFSHHSNPVENSIWDDMPTDIDIINQESDAVRYQLGTLGGGNHFIELQCDVFGFVHIMVHTGSRNFGYKIAEYYAQKAKEYCSDNNIDLPDEDLSYLPDWHNLGKEYIRAMNYALQFAKESRNIILQSAYDAMIDVVGYPTAQVYYTDTVVSLSAYKPMFVGNTLQNVMDVHHNYASLENHFDTDVWVHRKGATLAGDATTGLIPGSQGTSSYIVLGNNNRDSFHSCSHGAGRAMSRNRARKELSLEDEKARLDEQGIVHSISSTKDLDEAPSAYKNIEDVMEYQSDLVNILMKLTPMAVIKG